MADHRMTIGTVLEIACYRKALLEIKYCCEGVIHCPDEVLAFCRKLAADALAGIGVANVKG